MCDYSCESSRVNSSRLFVLATLAERGPMHGHQLRLQAQEDRTHLWTDIAPGALYGVLGRLQREGLTEAIRTEREGNYPERVVYRITDEGRRALRIVRDNALRTVVTTFDPFDLALARSGPVDELLLATTIERRLDELLVRRKALQHQLDVYGQWLNTAETEIVRHSVMRLDADIAWHESVMARVPDIARESHPGPPIPTTKETS